MAINQSSDSIQVGVTLLERFLDCRPDYFQLGRDGKLHHDPRKVNVFAHGKNLFGDTYGEELKVQNESEFAMIKHRLLTQPTFLKVILRKEKKSGNTRYITKGDFVIYLNNSHPVIQEQLRQKLNECEQLMEQGKNFALEINLAPALKAWYKTRFAQMSGSYTAEGANFCITNFGQRMHECYSPWIWIGCLPIMIICGPPYLIYRAAKTTDLECPVRATVTYIEGVNQAERQQLARMLVQAYVQGLNAGVGFPTGPSVPGAPPAYSEEAPPPPPYSDMAPAHT